MTRVPLDERRQLFLARQRANQALRDQLLAPDPHPLSPAEASHHRRRMVVKAVMIAMLVGLGVIVFQTVTFNPPTSIVEALLPRF
ncbi:MAG: hypothetical protein HYU24_04005 [Candidatus Rokubacteria bacterium]|nr:hypothetical protein [Candidatus Rokubacteria bacterium]